MSEPREIPYIKDIMKLRMMMKSNHQLAEEVKKSIIAACKAHGVQIDDAAIFATIFVHPEEIATTQAIPTLPVGSQCQAW